MKRRTLLFVITGSFALVLLAVCIFLTPYFQGSQSIREVSVVSNVLDASQRELKPTVICNRDEMAELIRRAKSRHPNYDPVRDMYGLAAFEHSVRDFDFSGECLVLIPYWHPAGYDAGLSRPYLLSRRLSCHVWYRNRLSGGWALPGRMFACIGIAVKRELVDAIEVDVGQGQADTVFLR